jgi:competence protein ComFC
VTIIHPIKISGQWLSGFALDNHTISSTCIGHNAYGYPIFETKYTEVGELMYRLKSRHDKSVVPELIDTIAEFMHSSWKPPITLIVPMVPSNAGRVEQPVFILAAALSERLQVPVRTNAVVKTKQTTQLKNIYDYGERMRVLDGAFSADPSLVAGERVLLFDDLYRSGATMNAVTAVLQSQGQAAEVYALAVTRTRIKR